MRLKFARRVYGMADAAIAVSQGIVDDLVEHTRLPGEHVCAVANPTYTPEIESAAALPLEHPWIAPGAPPLLLGAGRLVPAKDFATLVRAFSRVRARRPARLLVRAVVAWEGSPGVLVEAMACGCPVVSNKCPSGPDEILAGGRYGRLVPVGDDAALADAIIEALDSAALRVRAREFDVDRAVERYLDVLLRDA